MKKLLKKDKEKFSQLVHNYLVNKLKAEIKFQDETWRTEFIIDTICGKLQINLMKEQNVMLSVFTCFDNPQLALENLPERTKDNLNKYSGKWNFHLATDYTYSFACFKRAIEEIKIS